MRILRVRDVVAKVGYCRKHIYDLERRRRFPARVRLGPNSVGWLEHEIDAWIAERAGQRATNEPSASYDRDGRA